MKALMATRFPAREVFCSISTMLVSLGCQAPTPPQMSFDEVRTSVSIEHHGGETMSWDELIEHLDNADVVVLGELHDDHTGHLVQRAVVEDVSARRPGTVLAMEMLERDEQPVLDDYREGVISADTFTKLTFSESWAGQGSWDAWYLPIIDAAHEHDAVVIAANAPRRYVTLARTDGFERLKQLPDDRRRFVEWPDPPLEGAYRDRFMKLMSDGGEHEIDAEVADAFFRAQQTWDATMAGSVAAHRPAEGGASILMLGRFHSDHEGGTVVLLRRLLPDAEIVVISVGPPDEDVEGPPADLMIRDARTFE
ncbi:MAG: ChaN family lipoprotein [Planctomycetota bacterium]|nr:ChaN family lipoprotein [Planctomycetota bacterium]